MTRVEIITLVLIAAVFASCAPDCTAGYTHCDGDTFKYCESASMAFSSDSFKETDCGGLGMYCIDDDNYQGCALSEEPCPEEKESICVGDIVAGCSQTYPTCLGGWGNCVCTDNDQFCVDGDSDEAFCAISTEPCPQDNELACHPEDETQKIKCNDGFWISAGLCPEDTGCVEIPDAGVECQ